MPKVYKRGALDLDYKIFLQINKKRRLSELNSDSLLFIFLILIGIYAIAHGGVTSTNVDAIVEQSSLTLALTLQVPVLVISSGTNAWIL